MEPAEKTAAERKREKDWRWRAANREHVRQYSRDYRKTHRDRINELFRTAYCDEQKASKKAYYEDNRERILQQKRDYYLRKKDAINQYRERNKSKISAQNSRWHRKNRDKIRERKREETRRRYQNPSNRVAAAQRNRIRRMLKGIGKPDSSEGLIGCRFSEFINYIKAQFKPGMTMENYGKKWHIDHIIPCSAFDLTKDGEIRQCFHFTNLRPMWAKANMRKGSKITEPQLRLLL